MIPNEVVFFTRCFDLIIVFKKLLGIIQSNLQGGMHFRCLPKSNAIKLIDFGSTAVENQSRSSIVSTRHYRAPEIILGTQIIFHSQNSCFISV